MIFGYTEHEGRIMTLGTFKVIIYILMNYFIALPIGYLSLTSKTFKKLNSQPVFVSFPIYICVGISELTVISYVAGLHVINPITLVLAFSIPLIIILYRYTKVLKIRTIKNLRIETNNLAPFLLFIVTLVHFSSVVNYMKWPPIGDIVSHASLVSLINHNMKVPMNFSPLLPDISVHYPLGFHAFVATLNMLVSIYPALIVFVFGATIVTLIPSILYSIVFIKTDSKALSVLAWASAFIVTPPYLTRWVIGYFYNGPYPNLLGFLIFLGITAIVSSTQLQDLSIRKSLHLLLLLTLSTAALFLVYPPFSFFTLGLMMILFMKRSIANRRTLILFAFLVLLLVSIVSLNSLLFEQALVKLLQAMLTSFMKAAEGYYLSPSFFYETLNGLLILLMIPFSVYLIITKKDNIIAIVFLLVTIPVIVSTHRTMFSYFCVITPNRAVILSVMLSWVLASLFLHKGSASLKKELSKYNVILFQRHLSCKRILVVLLNIVIVISALEFVYPHFSFTHARARGWFANRDNFEDDLKALEWIHNNVDHTNLIMNDQSFTGAYLSSLSLKNVTYLRWMWPYTRERVIDLYEIWVHPYDYSNLLEKIERYDIKYILSTSDGTYRDYTWLGGDGRTKGKPINPAEIALLFDSYSFLTPVFKSGNARVYAVSTTDFRIQRRAVLGVAQEPHIYSKSWGEGKIDIPELIRNATSLKIVVEDGKYRCFGFYLIFGSYQDWSDATFFSFYWKGYGTGITFTLYIQDSDSQRLSFNFKDNVIGWKRFILPLNAFQGTGNWSKIKEIRFTTGMFGPVRLGVWNIDKLELITMTVHERALN